MVISYHLDAGNQTYVRPLQEQPVLLTIESSLWPLRCSSFPVRVLYRVPASVSGLSRFIHSSSISGNIKWECFLLKVPAHLQNSWESYYLEILMVTGLLAYIMNYIIGKNKNSRLAQAWFNSHRELLESNFTLVGKLSQSSPAACLETVW